MASAKRYEASFFTATILDWKYLLRDNSFKDIITQSLQYLTDNNLVLIHAFVIMDNHMHLVWHILHPHKREYIQRDFLKYTSRVMLEMLRAHQPEFLNEFYVNAKDRQYQIWERNSLTTDIWTEEMLKQKINYVHNNPIRAGLCEKPQDYKYSSASIYTGDTLDWGFVDPFFVRS